jgi:hypothetical protein
MLTTVQSTIRHILGMLLGSYVTEGFVTGDQVDILTNAIVTILGVVGLVAWSVIEKKLAKK